MTFTVNEFNKMYDGGIFLSLEDICSKLNLGNKNKNILIAYCEKVPKMEKIISSEYPRQGFRNSFARDLSEKLIIFDSIVKVDDDTKLKYLKNIFQLNKLFPTSEGEIVKGRDFLYGTTKYNTNFQDLMYDFELICRFKGLGWEITDFEPFTSESKKKKSEFRAEKDGNIVQVEAKKIDRTNVWNKMTGEPTITKQKTFKENKADYDNWEKNFTDKDIPFEVFDLKGLMATIKRQIEAAADKFDFTSDQYLIYIKGNYLVTREEVLDKIKEYLLTDGGGTQSFFDHNKRCIAIVFEEANGVNQGIALNPTSILTRDQIPMGIKSA